MPQPIKNNTSPVPNTIPKPVMPSAPSAAALAQTFDVSQLPELGSEIGQVVKVEDRAGIVHDKKVEVSEINKEEVKEEVKEEETKPEDKKEEVKKEVSKESDKKDEEEFSSDFIKLPETLKKEVESKKKDETPSKSGDPFDYKGFNDDEVGILKPLSLNARKKVADVLKENREIKSGSFLQHPRAYSITPEWEQASTEVQFLNKEGQFWAQQLEKCKLGKPFNNLAGWDKNGNPVISSEVQPTEALEENLRQAMTKSFSDAQGIQGRMQEYAKQFQSRIQNDMNGIESYIKKKFPWESDPRLLEASVNVQGQDRTFKQIRDDITGLFPAYLRHNIAVRIAGNMMIGLIVKDAEIASLKAKKNVETVRAKEEELVEPSSNNRPAPDKSNGPANGKYGGIKEFSLAGAPEDIIRK